jgi:hypothetical protein
MTDAEFAPLLAALGRCVEEGFWFRAITDGLHGFRIRWSAACSVADVVAGLLSLAKNTASATLPATARPCGSLDDFRIGLVEPLE